MDESLSNFDISASTVRVNTDSNSDQSDNFEELVTDEIEHLNDSKNETEAGPSLENSSPDLINTEDSNQEMSEAEFDRNLPETVTLLIHPNGNKVYLVGTAHFSKQSQEEVVKVMQTVKPHFLMLELCDSRVALLNIDEETMFEQSTNLNWDNLMNLIKKYGLYCGLTYILILNLNKHITKELGMAPGGEFRAAYQEAIKLQNCTIILGDRPVRVTLLRALSKLTWFQTIKLAFNLLFSKEPINKEDIENCKKRDMLEQLLAEMAGEYPSLGEVFLHERDIFLTHSLQEAAKSYLSFPSEFNPEENVKPLKVVGVIGIGHMAGITKLWPHRQARYIRDIMVVPPPSRSSRILKFTIKLSFYALAGYLVFKFVPVPRSVRRGCEEGATALLQAAKNSIEYFGDNIKGGYKELLHRS